jgi:hypothetical protein
VTGGIAIAPTFAEGQLDATACARLDVCTRKVARAVVVTLLGSRSTGTADVTCRK